ncbi:MAG: glycoside hydrolase family 99-like domain-containing protein, partial [Phycisphaeraceae bacterium]|nr:glycoside hydrolase family 99-like domain-containing protein [Phycisphaeraceae bacterium]
MSHQVPDPISAPSPFSSPGAIDRSDLTVAVINYPGFHPTPFMEAWHGFGWSEWELTCNAEPRFEGHRQPLEPAWGVYDESDPQWAAKETAAAADHGIDVWIYDWYWYSGVEIWNEALNDGFLKAENRERMKFGVMWANHTWNDCHPAPAGKPLTPLLPSRHSPEDLDRVVDYWAERYFSQPNYWRIDGHPWCGIFHYSFFSQNLGGDEGVARGLERMRERARS